MFDLIGDIHGYADPLKRLLTTLGYTDNGICWVHPSRKVIFLGDFVDRGPEQLVTVDEDYQDAPEALIAEEDVFDDIDAVVVDEDFDIDVAVELLYTAIYGE